MIEIIQLAVLHITYPFRRKFMPSAENHCNGAVENTYNVQNRLYWQLYRFRPIFGILWPIVTVLVFRQKFPIGHTLQKKVELFC